MRLKRVYTTPGPVLKMKYQKSDGKKRKQNYFPTIIFFFFCDCYGIISRTPDDVGIKGKDYTIL